MHADRDRSEDPTPEWCEDCGCPRHVTEWSWEVDVNRDGPDGPEHRVAYLDCGHYVTTGQHRAQRYEPTPPPSSPVTPEPPTWPATRALVQLSQWIDAGNTHRDPEAVTWGRLAKITEEAGEVIAAYIGATGQNPRKGITHDTTHVIDELLDVAVTALGAIEHLTDHHGEALPRLEAKLLHVARRAGLDP